MPDTPKMEFFIDQGRIVTLLFNNPQTGVNNFGPWYRYAVESGGSEMCIFASDGLHKQLSEYGKDAVVEIIKEEYEPDKTRFNVIPQEGTTTRSAMNVDNTPKNGSSSPDWDKINADKTADIHKQVCLKLAVQLHGTSKIALDKDETASIESNMYALLEILDNNNTPF